jgi:hypothetical protein
MTANRQHGPIMGSRNTPAQQRGYMAVYREKLRRAGLVPIEVWCRAADKTAVRAYARQLAGLDEDQGHGPAAGTTREVADVSDRE